MKTKKDAWKKHISSVFSMLIGGLGGLCIVSVTNGLYAAQTSLSTQMILIILMVEFVLATLAQIVIHEAGHLVFGLLSGYRFSSFRIANIMWVKENGRIKCKRRHIAGTAGQCLMAPPELVEGKLPVVLYNLGGSLMNTAVSLLFLGIYALIPEASLVSAVLPIFAIMGFVMAITNGVPMRTGMVDNDGYNALMLTRDREAVRSFWIQLKVTELIAGGARLKDMPEEWFVVPSDEKMKNALTAAVGVFACNRLMDAQDFDEADRLMAHMLETENGMVGLHRSLMICDRMYCELISQNRGSVLHEMRSKAQMKFMKSMRNFLTVLRTEYAFALLWERDRKKADKIKAQFEKCARSHPYSGDIESEWELVKIAEARAAVTLEN